MQNGTARLRDRRLDLRVKDPLKYEANANGAARPAAWAWASLAVGAAAIPFLPGLTGSRVFYVRRAGALQLRVAVTVPAAFVGT